MANGSVAFLDNKAFVLRAGEPKRIAVFNGSTGPVTVTVRASGNAGRVVSVRPAKLRLGRAQVGTFTVETQRPRAGELVAYGTDGTLARRSIALPKKPVASTDKAPPTNVEMVGTNYVPPTPLTGWINPNVVVPEQTFEGLRTPFPETVVGHLASDEGDVASVIRSGNEVSITDVGGAGEYEGTVQLSPEAEPTAVTLRVRDAWGWALLVLLVGLVLAAGSEAWLSRMRPRRELETRIARLKERCADHFANAKREVPEFRPMEGETLQRVYLDDKTSSLVKNEGERLNEGLHNALSDDERQTWGPSGEKLKALEKQEDAYAELLRNCVDLAATYGPLERSVMGPESHELARGPLTQAVEGTLRYHVITTSAELDERKAAAAKLRGFVGSFVGYFRALENLEQIAAEKNLTQSQTEAIKMRWNLIRTYDGDEADSKEWKKKVNDLRQAIGNQQPAANPQDHLLRSAWAELEQEDATAEMAGAEIRLATTLTSTGDSPQSPLVPPRPRSRELRRKLVWADLAFAGVTWPIVVAAGLAVLYFTDPTFGSTGDYLAAFVWGSTAEIALTLLRRLIPTTFGGLRIDKA
jgi:hypothetical protein